MLQDIFLKLKTKNAGASVSAFLTRLDVAHVDGWTSHICEACSKALVLPILEKIDLT